jgi:hypothetical protein
MTTGGDPCRRVAAITLTKAGGSAQRSPPGNHLQFQPTIPGSHPLLSRIMPFIEYVTDLVD